MSKKEIVVVIGPGRSGTSLAMNLLRTQGMRTGKLVEQVDTANPLGDFEDQDITAIHEEIFQTLGISPLLPRDISRQETRRVRGQMDRLRDLLLQLVGEAGPIWGFKDPRTSSLLPLWDLLFRETDVQPRFVLCIRNPGAVVSSMKTHFARDESLSEMLWLSRVTESVLNSDREVFLVHYEDWFESESKALDLAKRMLKYASLPVDGASEAVARIVRANLNRATGAERATNPLAKKMYDTLRGLPSGPLATAPLLPLAKECKQVAAFYTATVLQFTAGSGESAKARQEVRQLEAKLELLQKESVAGSAERGRMEKQLADLQAAAAEARQDEEALQARANALDSVKARLEAELAQLRGSAQATEERASQLAAANARLEGEVAQIRDGARAMQERASALASANARLEGELSQVRDSAQALQDQAEKQALQLQKLERARAGLEEQAGQLTSDLERARAQIDFEVARNQELGTLRATLEREAGELRMEHASLAVEMTGMVEEHRRVVLRLKATVDDNERLRVQAKAQPAPAPRRERIEVSKPAASTLPVVVVRKKKEPVQISPARRKVRKLVRTPGLFFSDWYAKVRA